MHKLRHYLEVLVLAPAITACGGPGMGDDARNGPDAEPDAGMPMHDMPGMADMQDGGMMEQMQSHMQMMQRMGPDSMAAMMPEHRQMVANMIARMNREMRDMNMSTDETWDATVDSLRQDLTSMPEMTGPELDAFMPGHHRRVMNLMEMHREMMRDMRM